MQPQGRLYRSRQAVIDCVGASDHLDLVAPKGAMYAFVRLADHVAERMNDQRFALELLEKRQVLVAPGSSFNTPYNNHFRITTLPDPATIRDVFARIEDLLEQHA